MSDKKSVQIKGKHNLDLLLKRERKRVDNIIPELNEKYDTRYSQLQLINCIYLNLNCGSDQELVKKALMKKLSGYKSQDVRKKIYNNKMFITFDNMIQRLVDSWALWKRVEVVDFLEQQISPRIHNTLQSMPSGERLKHLSGLKGLKLCKEKCCPRTHSLIQGKLHSVV